MYHSCKNKGSQLILVFPCIHLIPIIILLSLLCGVTTINWFPFFLQFIPLPDFLLSSHYIRSYSISVCGAVYFKEISIGILYILKSNLCRQLTIIVHPSIGVYAQAYIQNLFQISNHIIYNQGAILNIKDFLRHCSKNIKPPLCYGFLKASVSN